MSNLQQTISGNFGLPLYYDYGTALSAIGPKPSTVHVHDNGAAYFYKRQLLQRAMSAFKFTLPENWDHDYFLYILYCAGFVGVFDTAQFGVIPQHCSLKGYNVFYRPTDIVVANPLLPLTEYRIGESCEVVKLTPDYFGVMDIVEYYGDLLAVTFESLAMNMQNSKLAYVFATADRKTAESLKKLFDNVQGGDLAAFYSKDLQIGENGKPWEVFANDLSKNFIADDIMETMRDIFNQFDTEIGIDNNTLAKKKERVTVSEVEANNDEVYSKVDLWFDTVKKGFEKVNNMFYSGQEKCKIEWRGGSPYAADNSNINQHVSMGTDAV